MTQEFLKALYFIIGLIIVVGFIYFKLHRK